MSGRYGFKTFPNLLLESSDKVVILLQAVKPARAQANKAHFPIVKVTLGVVLMFEYICIVSRVL
jgi:hypothetical protein